MAVRFVSCRVWQRRMCPVILALLLAALVPVRGQDSLSHSASPFFVENRGQWDDNVRFRSGFRGGAIFLENDAVTYVMQNREQVEEIQGRKFAGASLPPASRMVGMYAYRVRFVGCLPSVNVRGGGRHGAYHNYYLGNNPARWASGVPLFDSVCYEGVYEGVDLHYFLQKSSYKYEFRVAPYAMPEQIALRYEGADRLSLRNGNLLVKIADFEAVEMRPYAYQTDADGERHEVACRFERRGTTVRFKLGSYDRSLPLVIDPVLVFCSYTGSFADNWGYTATYDRHGNMYGGGAVFDDGYPYTLGAYQTDYGGGTSDIAISKFSPKGDTLLFSTYLGGRKSEVPHSLVVNDNDELYLLASTSSWDFPVTSGAYDTLFNWSSPPDTFILTNVIYYLGGIDIAISRFSSDGRQLLSSTYFGGSGPDGLATDISLRKNYADEVRGEIMVDAYSNVYVVSSTASKNLPVSSTAFQKNYGGGGQDGCIAKFSYDLQHLIWCSYLGGDSSDAAYSMVLDKENNLYVCGGTRSRNLPVTRGVVQPLYGGGETDGYIAHISANGNRILEMTYWGKDGFDQVYLIKMDQSGCVFIMGLTDAAGKAWVQNAKWFVNNGGQVLAKLRSELDSVIWSTAFGTGNKGPDLSPTALMVDLCHQVYFSGWGSPNVNAHVGNTNCGTRGLPISQDAMRFITDNNDFYFLSLNHDASNMIYGTFFGGNFSAEHVDGGTSRFDRKGVIYQAICASCGGRNDLPVTSGVVGPRNNSRNCNLGVVKMDFNIQEVVADFAIPNVICAPSRIVCANTSRVVDTATTTFQWDFGDGTFSSEKAPIHLYAVSGTYRVRLIVSDPKSCNLNDTLERDIVVLSSSFDTLPDRTICKGDFVQIGLQPASSSKITYHWSPADGLSSTEISNPIAFDTVSRTYRLLISDGVCTDTLQIRVNVSDIALEAGPDRTLCVGDTLRLNPSVKNADEFAWSLTPDFSSILNFNLNQSSLELDNWQGGTYYIRASNSYCTVVDSVHVSASQVSVTLPEKLKVCYGDTFNVKANAVQSDWIALFQYDWQPAGLIVSGHNSDSVMVRAERSGFLTVEVRNQNGCIARDTVEIVVDTLRAAVEVTPVRCHGESNGGIDVSMLSGHPPYNYSWTPSIGSGLQHSGLPAGEYHFEATDSSGCRISMDIKVEEPLPVSASIVDSQLQVYCGRTCDGWVEMAVSGGVPPYSCSWINGDTTLKLNNLCAGVYRFVAEDSNHCADTVTVEVRDTSDMRVKVTVEDVRCHGKCDGTVRLEPSGISPYRYQWTTGDTTALRKGLCPGSYDVTVEDARRCRRRVFPEVSEPDPIVADSVQIVPPLCFGQSNGEIHVWVSGGRPSYIYIWDGQEGGQVCTNLPAGAHRLHCVDANGCSLDTIILLPQRDSLAGSLRVSKVPCRDLCIAEGKAAVFGGTPPYSFLWGNGDSGSVTSSLCYGSGVFEVTDSNGCVLRIPYFVDDSNTFPNTVQAWADHYTIYSGEKVNLYATELGPGFSYHWSPAYGLLSVSGSSVQAAPEDSITYTVIVNDTFGCQKSDTVRIRVIKVYCEHPYVFVANTFSPNGDGINDVLYVRGDWVESLHFAIYDRWGEKMFETDNQARGWDGTYRGKPCEQGVYVYYLEVSCKGGAKNLLKGNVTLVR